jgi:CBS domain-containing membrane protein
MAQGKSQWAPALAGATARDRILAGLGAILGICLTGFISSRAFPEAGLTPLIVAPIGASSVLLFAVPSSPLAQPWSIVGGNVISALVGIAIGLSVGDPVLASGVAVGLAIVLMSLTRSLHPPGGAVALMTVMATHQSHAANFFYAINPVGLNSAILVVLGWIFHLFTRHSYPHVAARAPGHLHGTQDEPPQMRGGFRTDDVDAVLAELRETFDIDRDDIARLLRLVELRVFQRLQGSLSCGDIMSRDVVSIDLAATTDAARDLMRARRLRSLPVVDRFGVLAGVATAGDLIGDDAYISAVAKPALVATAERPALGFVAQLTDGRAHEVVVVDDRRRVIGLITQTDLLVALARQATERQLGFPATSSCDLPQ